MMRATTLKAGGTGVKALVDYYAGLAEDQLRRDGRSRGPMDYYLDPNEPPGRWWGEGCPAVGLSGDVRPCIAAPPSPTPRARMASFASAGANDHSEEGATGGWWTLSKASVSCRYRSQCRPGTGAASEKCQVGTGAAVSSMYRDRTTIRCGPFVARRHDGAEPEAAVAIEKRP